MKKISDELLKMKRIVYCGVEPYANLKMYRKRLKDDEVLVCIVPKTKVTPEPIADTIKKLKHRCWVYEIGGHTMRNVLNGRAESYIKLHPNSERLVGDFPKTISKK